MHHPWPADTRVSHPFGRTRRPHAFAGRAGAFCPDRGGRGLRRMRPAPAAGPASDRRLPPRRARPAWADGWQDWTDRIGAIVYCPSFFPGPLTAEIDGQWNTAKAPGKEWQLGFAWLEHDQLVHIVFEGYPAGRWPPSCPGQPCFADVAGHERIGGFDVTWYDHNSASHWHHLAATFRGQRLRLRDQHARDRSLRHRAEGARSADQDDRRACAAATRRIGCRAAWPIAPSRLLARRHPAARHRRGRVRASALAADRGLRAAPRERRADPQHPLLPQQGPIAGRLRWRDGRHATVGRAGDAARTGLRRARAGRSARPAAACWPGARSSRPASWQAALASAGTAIGAVEAVLDGDCAIAYALVRPPGHHAAAGDDRRLLLLRTRAGRRGRPPPRRRAGGDHRLGRPPRQRHAGVLLRPRRRADGLAAHAARLLGAVAPPDRLGARGRDGRREGFNVNVELGLRQRRRAPTWRRWSAWWRRSSTATRPG